jgi:hypothetical protein
MSCRLNRTVKEEEVGMTNKGHDTVLCVFSYTLKHTQTYLDIIPRERESAKLHKLIPTTERTNLSNTLLLLLRSYFSKTKRIRRRKKKSIKWQLTRIYNSLYKDKTGSPPLFRNGNFYGLAGSVVTIYGRVLRYPKKSRQPWFSLWAKEREREVWLATQRQDGKENNR